MAFCCKCRRYLNVTPTEFIDRNAWCPRCQKIVATSLIRVPFWILGVIIFMSFSIMLLRLAV